jgi:ABC-type antimicrobial peptide transport system permease subunit
VEVVGVVKDTRMEMVMERSRPGMFFPLRPAEYRHPPLQGMTLMVRAVPGVDPLAGVRRTVSAMDASVTLFNARTMTGQIDRMMFFLRIGIWIYGTIGLFGLVLASTGLAGVTAYSVAQRVREIGIRMALGADRGDVLGLVMKEGAALVAVGTVIGLAGAWAGTRLLATVISAVTAALSTSASDPVLLVGAPLLLASLAMIACYLPARKSMRIDPMTALRHD